MQKVLDEGINSLAVVLMHSYTFPEHEQVWPLFGFFVVNSDALSYHYFEF